MKSLKLLMAGTWRYEIYESACARALKKLGVDVIPFNWNRYFPEMIGRLELNYIIPGPFTYALNRDLIRCVSAERPDIVFIWRGTHILPQTLRVIKRQMDILTVSYNNDDPYSPIYQKSESMHLRRLWHFFNAAISEYDVHFVYRQRNINDFYRAGAKKVHLLRSYYVPDLHHPVTLTPEERHRYGCDIVFVGHYEPQRFEYLQSLVSLGIKVKLFGSKKSWTNKRLGKLADYFGTLHHLDSTEYAKALCGAKMCLCVFSRLNQDTYTRRVFEIPACGRMLLSERTVDMQRLFKEDKEAIYFANSKELVKQTKALINQSDRIEMIANAGRKRCIANGHSVDDRMYYMLKQLEHEL